MRAPLIAILAWPVLAPGQFETELAPRDPGGAAESSLPFEPREEPGEEAVDESAVLIPELAGVLVQPAGGPDVPGAERRVAGVELLDLTVDRQDELVTGLRSFLGGPLTGNGLDRLIDLILRHYERNDRPVTEVYAPAQDLADGTIRLEVIEGRIGVVGLQTGGQFNDELLGGAVRLQQGELLRTSDLQEHLDWFNRNPFRSAALYAGPGMQEGEADLVFAFTEGRPWRLYAGYENSGAEAAGENRYLAGFNWGNAFGLDQHLSYQFTMGDSYEELHAHAATWEIPIHRWHHFVRLSGGWAEIRTESNSAGTAVTSEGTGWQVGGAYGIQLPRWKEARQEVTFGVEFKSSDNFLIFGGGDAHPGTVVEVVQFRGDYRATRRYESGALEVQASLVGSPGGLSGRNEDDDFALFRAGAEASYLYGRAEVSWVRRLPEGWSLRAAAHGQLASGALLPTEQFALGGHATVRGYEERDYLADHGYALSAEFRAPAIDLPAGRLADTQIQFLGFLDHGMGWRDETAVGEDARDSFTSLGIGARAQAGSLFNLRADLGVPLEDGNGLRGHLGVTVAY